MRSIAIPGAMLLLASILSAVPAGVANAAPQKKEYLSEAEAGKIREAGATGPRIVLFATFASDRIKKLQYEFAHFDATDQKRTDRLNRLINGYTGCIDDAADLIEIGIDKQQDIRGGVKALQAGKLAGAGLDVYEHEPRVHSALIAMKNVVLVPHIGSATAETRLHMALLASVNLLAALDGKRPPNLLNPEVLD